MSDDHELERLYGIFLDRGNSFLDRLVAFRGVNDLLGIVTVPDDMESQVDDYIVAGRERDEEAERRCEERRCEERRCEERHARQQERDEEVERDNFPWGDKFGSYDE